MALINYAEKTKTRRFASKMVRPKKVDLAPARLRVLLSKHSGRSGGKITVRHQGGRHKRQYRVVDFKRDNYDVEGTVMSLEYDPNRNVDVALIKYLNGDFRYILAPRGLAVNDKVLSGEKVEVKIGNAMKLKHLPIGTVIHNVELTPGKGGQIGRAAGTGLILQAKQDQYAHLKLPSGEVRMVPQECLGTVGALGNEEWKNMNLGKAGRKRHMGIRPTVRGSAMDPNSHPHGGGEGRSPIGRKKPMTKYGRPAVGRTRKRFMVSDKYIVKKRSKK